MTVSPRLVLGSAVAALAVGGFAASPAVADHTDATIHPGVQTVTEGGQCTANFVFTNGPDVFIGQSAHCSSTGGSTDTDGCDSGSLPIGTPVEIDGATQPGTLAYNSWLTMQAVGEQDPDACAFNDFALVKVAEADEGRVSSTIPVIGGPTGIDTDGTRFGDPVSSYGNSSLRLGISALSPKEGTSVGTSGDGWTHAVYTATPGIPGDSGSAFINDAGQALGVLSTLAIAPLAGSNGVTDLAKALDYANNQGRMGVTLQLG